MLASVTHRIKSAALRAPSFRMMLARCFSTVFSLILAARATALLVNPVDIRFRISVSRAERTASSFLAATARCQTDPGIPEPVSGRSRSSLPIGRPVESSTVFRETTIVPNPSVFDAVDKSSVELPLLKCCSIHPGGRPNARHPSASRLSVTDRIEADSAWWEVAMPKSERNL